MTFIKKNLLDLVYNKNLQIYNTSVIIFFTYLIGLFVALITNQLNYSNTKLMIFVGLFSLATFICSVLAMSKAKRNMSEAVEKIRDLEK